MTAEIFVNCCALISIFFASKNLKRTKIYEDKIQFNLTIICFFFSFFLRPYGLHLAEFGTKSSYFLILFYPYLALILIDKKELLKKDLIIRGVLMGLIVCLKPHYLIFIALIEIYFGIKYRSIRYFFEIDKLILALILSIYFILIQKIHPNFFEYVVPMWSSYFQTYKILILIGLLITLSIQIFTVIAKRFMSFIILRLRLFVILIMNLMN